MIQGELVASVTVGVGVGVGLRLGAESGREDGRHLRLLLLNEAAEAEGEAEVGEHGGVVQGRVQGLELDCVGRLRLGLGLLLSSAKR